MAMSVAQRLEQDAAKHQLLRQPDEEGIDEHEGDDGQRRKPLDGPQHQEGRDIEGGQPEQAQTAGRGRGLEPHVIPALPGDDGQQKGRGHRKDPVDPLDHPFHQFGLATGAQPAADHGDGGPDDEGAQRQQEASVHHHSNP
jgi:hypothetical protein